MPIKFLVLREGRGFWVFLGGGGGAELIVVGARIFHFSAENQPEILLTEVFLNPPGVMDVRAFGSGMPTSKCLFSRTSRA